MQASVWPAASLPGLGKAFASERSSGARRDGPRPDEVRIHPATFLKLHPKYGFLMVADQMRFYGYSRYMEERLTGEIIFFRDKPRTSSGGGLL
jgi:hypothetical protein